MKKIYFQSYLEELCKKLDFKYERNMGSIFYDKNCFNINQKIVIQNNLISCENYINHDIDDNDFKIFSNKMIDFVNNNMNQFDYEIANEYLKVFNAFNSFLEKENLEKVLDKNDNVINEVKKIKKI